eukprot:Clim_evm52s147 gene=Clim_evmTU52s147
MLMARSRSARYGLRSLQAVAGASRRYMSASAASLEEDYDFGDLSDYKPCCADKSITQRSATQQTRRNTPMMPRPALHDDPEETGVPQILRDHLQGKAPLDAHTHIFPEKVNHALHMWFERNGWPIRYRANAENAIAPHIYYLEREGMSPDASAFESWDFADSTRLAALSYAHKQGIASSLNRFLAKSIKDLNSKFGKDTVVGFGALFPGEVGWKDILKEAFAKEGECRLKGLKLHTHVQGIACNDPASMKIYEWCQAFGVPVINHAGREPNSPEYPRDTHEICEKGYTAEVLERFPEMTFVVPHCGADEFDGYRDLLDAYPNLFLDTTMMASDYFETISMDVIVGMIVDYPERIMFGTDFPNIPYGWSREMRVLTEHIIKRCEADEVDPGKILRKVFGGNAAKIFDLKW